MDEGDLHQFLLFYSPLLSHNSFHYYESDQPRWLQKGHRRITRQYCISFSFCCNFVCEFSLVKCVFCKVVLNFQNPYVAHFLPTLILWAVAALLPNLVYYTDKWIGHWTRSSEHHAVMRKTFIFLLLMVLILPSLGLTRWEPLLLLLLRTGAP